MVTAQVSLYPLRQVSIGPAIREAVRGFRQHGLETRLHQTVYDAAHFYGVEELKRRLRSVTGGKAHVVWRTTLFPRRWPCSQAGPRRGGFIGVALIVSDGSREVERWTGRKYGWT
jgi:hypothetical protein